MSRSRPIPWCVSHCIAALLVVVLSGCERGVATAPADRPVVSGEQIVFAAGAPELQHIQTQRVLRDTGALVTLPGRLTWDESRTVRVMPPLAGRVTRIVAKVGDAVKPGAPLAVVAAPDFLQARADLARAEADASLAEKVLARAAELHQAGVTAAKDLQSAQTDAARTRAERERALRRLQQLGTDAASGEWVLKSPIAGTVVDRAVNPGQELRPDQATPVFVISDPTLLTVQLDAREEDLAAVERDKTFYVEVRAFPGERFAARITHVADFVDPVSRAIRVRGEIANADRRLKADQYVTAQLTAPPSSRQLLPATAIYLEGEAQYAFVRTAPATLERRRVSVRTTRADSVEVRTGVAPGDEVVVSGVLHLARLMNKTSEIKTIEAAATGRE